MSSYCSLLAPPFIWSIQSFVTTDISTWIDLLAFPPKVLFDWYFLSEHFGDLI